jgi:hypothetical protein
MVLPIFTIQIHIKEILLRPVKLLLIPMVPLKLVELKVKAEMEQMPIQVGLEPTNG